ncbi:toprim domain-containing protein [Phenylobacterium kunshanense]|uniref:Virulence-associated protein E n=1 Tax=Phenylobacterium kunshanense TaxID=1445034 RepID=A0A328BKB6_9CAUL|nr:toprim domain-containing protein [Phenylobacterium kunshanense]RAK66374.1 virulence-associated protein E [Phenylobacterium kunshanense]
MSRAATLAPIVRALGGDLWAGGRRANVPGPGHGPDDRSVSLLLSRDRVVVHCFAGDDWRTVLAEIEDLGLVDGEGRLVGAGGALVVPPPAPGRRERLAAAQQLWSEGRPLGRSLSARHLDLRGVAAPTEGLRHHPEVPAAVYAGAGPRRPALLAAIRDAASGDLVGVEVTYLAPNGTRALLRLPRKTVGLCPPGAAVRFAPAGPRLLVGEGVFTSLSAAGRFGLPAWALLSTRNLRRWRPPAGVRFVLIAADRGADGEASARALAASLRASGVAVALRWPPPPFGDWNEALGMGPGEVEGKEGRGRAGAADGRSGPSARRPTP